MSEKMSEKGGKTNKAVVVKDDKTKVVKKKAGKKLTAVEELTDEEREAVTIVFHQFETGLREGTIFTKVRREECFIVATTNTFLSRMSCKP